MQGKPVEEGAAPRDRLTVGLPIALALAWVLGFSRLVEWDPAAGARNIPTGDIEAFFFSPAGSSPTLLLILAGWIAFRRRHDLFAAMTRPEEMGAIALGLVTMLLAAGLSLWAQYVDFLGLLIPAMSLMLLGAGLFLAGWRGALIVAVPALFLVLAYPHPAVALNSVIYPMQLFTADSTVWILDLVGVEAQLSGDLIFVPDGRVFQVIENCAGVRMIETMVMSAAIYAEVFDRRGAQAFLLVLAAPVLGVIANQIRVLTLIANPFSNIDPIHSAQGIAMIVVGVLAVAAVDMVLQRLPRERFDRSWTHVSFRWRAASDAGLRAGASRIVAVCALLVAIGVGTWVLPRWSPPGSEGLRSISSLSPRLGEWRASGLDLDTQFLGSVGFVEWVHRRYFIDKDDPGAFVFVGVNNRLEPRMSLISDKTAAPGPGFAFVERSEVVLDPDKPPVDRIVWRRGRDIMLTFHWYQGVASFPEELVRSAFALDRGPWRRPGRSTFARVSMEMPHAPDRWLRAEQELTELATLVQADLIKLQKPKH